MKHNIALVDNANEIRQAFIEKFTMTWDEFKITHKEWIDALAAKNYTVTYEERLLWELMDHRAISFAKALDFLRTMQGDVSVMSERESHPERNEFEMQKQKQQNLLTSLNMSGMSRIAWMPSECI